MDHPFRSAALGGFNKQDVLSFLEEQSKQSAQAQQWIQGQLDEANRQVDISRREGEEARQQLEEGIDAHTKEVRSEEPGRLECDIAYPGTEISFGDEVLRLRQLSRKCIVKMIRGEIVVM